MGLLLKDKGDIAGAEPLYREALEACREVLGDRHPNTLIAINNLRDREGDAEVGKRTLAVRLGRGFALWEIGVFLLVPYAMNLFWLGEGAAAGWMPWLALPLAVWICRGVAGSPGGAGLNRFLALSSLHMLAFAVLWVVGVGR